MKYLKIQELVELKRAVTVTPKYPPYDTTLGFAIGISEEMLLLHEMVEFHLSGYAAMPIEEIRAVRSKKAERTMERIFEAEGLLDKVGADPIPPLNDWPDLLRWLRDQKQLVQVEFFETMDPGYTDEAFAVGKITGLTNRSVGVLNFSTSGQWDLETTVIGYEKIKRVRWGTEYIRVFSKYLP